MVFVDKRHPVSYNETRYIIGYFCAKKEREGNFLAAKTLVITALHLSHGGAERMIVSMANGFAARGFEVEILCTYRLGEPAYALSSEVKVTYLTSDRPNRAEIREAIQKKNPVRLFFEVLRAMGILLRKKRTMISALKALKADVCISTRHEHSLLLSKYAPKSVYKLAQLHSDHGFDPRLIREMRTGYTNIDLLPLFFDNVCAEVEGFFEGVEKRPRLVTVPDFIEEPCVSFSEKKEEKRLLAAGRLHPDKDFFSLLRIFRLVLEKEPEARLAIAGEGEQEAALKDYANELGIASSVDFLGALPYETLLCEMANSTAFALTSKSESFALVLVEAMSVGTVPVAYDVRVGPRGILTDAKDGFLVPHGDERAFCEKVLLLFSDGALRTRMEREARESAPRFYKDTVMDRFAAVIEEGIKDRIC